MYIKKNKSPVISGFITALNVLRAGLPIGVGGNPVTLYELKGDIEDFNSSFVAGLPKAYFIVASYSSLISICNLFKNTPATLALSSSLETSFSTI